MTMLFRTAVAAIAALCLMGPASSQQAPKIGPTFGGELASAGCANGVSWGSDGTLSVMPGVDATCPQRVLAAHDPTKQVPRQVHVSDLLDVLSPAQRATITTDHMQRLQARAAKGTVTAADPKVGRAAADIGMTPDAWVASVPAN